MEAESSKPIFSLVLRLALSTLLALPGAGAAEGSGPTLGWSTTGRTTVVSTNGNGSSLSAGLELALLHRSRRSELQLAAGTLQVRNQTLVREAIGSEESFEVLEREEEDRLAESSFFSIDHSHHLGETLRWVSHLGWERNEPSGFSNRYSASIGLGWATKTEESHGWRTSLSLAWIRQEDLVFTESAIVEYPGLRIDIGFDRPVADNSTWESHWVLHGNFDETDDVRLNWSNTFRVAVNRSLALELEIQWSYDSQPALAEIPLLPAPSMPAISTVAVPLDQHETNLSLALVLHL